MTFWETLLLAVALSMDAVAVSVANSLAYRCKAREMAAMPLLFGGFQGLMPLLGYWVGGLFADLVHGTPALSLWWCWAILVQRCCLTACGEKAGTVRSAC